MKPIPFQFILKLRCHCYHAMLILRLRYRFDTSDPTVRRIIGKHFEAIAQSLGLSGEVLGAYFDACAAAAAGPSHGKEELHAPVSAPSPPPGFR